MPQPLSEFLISLCIAPSLSLPITYPFSCEVPIISSTENKVPSPLLNLFPEQLHVLYSSGTYVKINRMESKGSDTNLNVVDDRNE